NTRTSELQAQSHLNSPSRADSRADTAEVTGAARASRKSKVRTVRKILHITAELQPPAFRDAEPLLCRKINANESGAATNGAGTFPKRADTGILKRAGIEVPAEHLRPRAAAVERRIAKQIGTLARGKRVRTIRQFSDSVHRAITQLGHQGERPSAS